MYHQASSSNKPVRRRRSSDDGCGKQEWTCALIEEDPMQVKWYCPVGSKERLGNKADLMRYWRKHHGHDRVPSCFNFLTRDVPPWCKRLDDVEEKALRWSCGGGSRGRDTLSYGVALVSPNPRSAVVSPALTTKVPAQASSQGLPSSSDTTAPTPASSSRREGHGPAVAPGVGVRAAAVRSPMGAVEQENELPLGGKQGGVPEVKRTALSSRKAAGTRERDARLSECSAASTPPYLSRASVSVLKTSHEMGKFDAFPHAPTPGDEYMRQTDSEIEEQEEGGSCAEEAEEGSDDVEFTQLDPGVAAELAAAVVAPAVTAESKQEANEWMELSGDSDRAADGALSDCSSADGGGGNKMDLAHELGDEVAVGQDGSPSGEDSSADSRDDDQMDVVISDDGEDSGGEWVAPQEADVEADVPGIEGDDKANVVSSGAAGDGRLQEHAKPVRRVRRSLRGRETKPLPAAPQACQFLLETQRFGYKKGKGWAMVSKDDSIVLEYDQTPQYIADRPGILEEFEEWSRQEASKEDEDTTSIEGGDGEEGEQMEARTTPERDLEQQSIEGGGERRDNGSNSESDDCDDGFNGGSDTNDFHANQRRVAPRRKSARFHNPKPNVPRLQAVWDFLSNEKKWKYVKVGGEYMVAGPDPGSGPVAQSRLQDFMADHRDLLEECKDWLGEQESEKEEPPKQPNCGRVCPTLARRRSPRLSGVEQDLPESRYAWQFVRGEKGWKYHKDGICIVGPEPDDIPIEFRELPNYIAENARLRREYNKWRRDLEREEKAQKKKMKNKNSEAKRRAQQQKVKTPRETRARQASASEDKNNTGKRRKLLREPIPSRAQKKEGGWGRVRGARSGSDTDSKNCKNKRVPRLSARHEDLSVGVSTVAAPSSESEADGGDSAVDDAPKAQKMKEDESSEEEIKANSEKEWSDNSEDSESMDEEEKRTLLMRDLRLEDMNRLYVWQFLREEEDWTYRNGGLESSHIYFKRGTPRGAEIGVHIFRSLEEVRDMVRRNPALRKRFYEYYQKDMLANCSKVEPVGTKKKKCQNGAASGAANAVSTGSAACHWKAKATRASVSPAAASVATTAAGEHAVYGSKSGSVTTSVVGTKASSRYTERAMGPTSDGDMEEDEPSPPPQQNRKHQKNAKASVPSGRSSRAPRSLARVSENQGLPPEDDKKKAGGPKRRVKSSQATARDKQTTGGGGGGCVGRSRSIVASEAEFIDPPEFPGPKETTCGVCLGPGSADGSDMFLQCREPRCSSRVHKSCYPVNVRSIHDEFFRCNACVAGSTEPKSRGCAICRRTQGVDGYAMIPTKDGQLVHYLCFKKVVRGAENHQFFDKATKKFSPPGGVTEAIARAASRRVKPCRVCHRTGGVLKRCFRVDCKIRFHPLCGAVRSAEVLNEGGEGMGLGADMAILCETHVEQADKDCSVCEQPGTVGDMIACCRCDTHYHHACLNPPMTSNEENEGAATVGWICADCKSACASLAVDGSEDDDVGEDGDEREEEAIESSQDEEAQEEEEPPVPGSPEWIGWQRRQAKKNVKGKAKAKGKGKVKSNSPVPKDPSPLANQGTKGRSTKGRCVRSQKGRVKATKGGGGGRGGSAREYALERRRALEAMWSSCEEDDDEYGTSDGEGDSEDGIATSYANTSKPRTEAFTAIPVGAQAYFNSHAGVKTLAVVTGGVTPAEGARNGSGVGASKGAVTTRVVHKRGWHARNKYSRAAMEDRLSEERAGRKRARRDAGGGTESGGVGGGSVDDEEEEDWEAAGAGTGTAGGSAFFGEGGEARVEELLRLTQEPVRDQLDALMSKHAHSFASWKSEMDWGWSLLFYGVGSKRELLQRLEDYVDHQGADGGAVVGYDGFNANASVRGLLDSLCEEVLYRKSQELSSTSLQTYASNFVKAFELEQRRSAMSNAVRTARPGFTASTGGVWRGAQEGDSLRRSSVASGKAARDGVDRFFEAENRAVPRRLFIFVHSIDGEKLRNEDSQAALAELSASPVVHLAASIDHVNAPLMWDVGLAGKFNWAWHKTHTYQPYVEELRNRRAWCSEEDEVLALSRLSMVMKALTPRHFDVVVCLAKKLKSSPELGGKWNYKELLAELKSNLSADNSQILDLLLVELKDHNVLTDEKTGNSRYLSIPGGPEVIDYLAGYQR